MHRQLVYPGAIPLETDLLYTNKFAMVGLAKLAAAVMGGNTYVNGLACTPTSPASMVVNVAPGEIYSLANIDGTAYSSLAADTTHTILKQGIVLDATQFTLTAPSTAGYSTNYLVEACYTDSDGGAVVLPYYNSANPSSAYNGPNGAGTAQNTYRAGVCTLAIKAGVPATTGTQTTPAVDTGYTALYVITVSQGATSITAANIALAAGAPFLPANGLIDGIQRKVMTYAADTGAANAYVAQYFPALLSITDGTEVEFKARVANTGASTFNPNGLGASPILTLGGNALTGGEIPAGSQVRVKWNATLSSWLIVSASGITVAQTLANLGLGTGLTGIVGQPRNAAMDITTASSTATWTADELVVETAIGGMQYRLNNLSLTVNLATTGAGGMDTGSAPASGYVAIYAIYNPTTKVMAALAVNVTSAKAPEVYGGSNMPSGYTASALVTVVPTNSSGRFIAGTHVKDREIATSPRLGLSNSTTLTALTALSLSGCVPLNAKSCKGYTFCNPGGTGGTTTLIVASDSLNSDFSQTYAGSSGNGADSTFDILLPTQQLMYYSLTNTNSGTPNATIGVTRYRI